MNNIKFLRDQSGITQTKLGELMGVSKQCVCNYEKNLSQPPFARVRAAINAVNKMGHQVTIDDVYPPMQELKQAS